MEFWRFNFSTNPDISYIYNVYNFPLNFRSSGDSFFFQIQTFHSNIMYKISNLIFLNLDIKFLSKSEYSVHLMYTIFRWITQIYTISFSANPNILYKYNVRNFLSNLCSFGCSIFLQIQTFHTNNVHNFPLNFRSSGYSIFLQIQTFRKYTMYTIFHWIYVVLDIHFFCKSRDRKSVV